MPTLDGSDLGRLNLRARRLTQEVNDRVAAADVVVELFELGASGDEVSDLLV